MRWSLIAVLLTGAAMAADPVHDEGRAVKSTEGTATNPRYKASVELEGLPGPKWTADLNAALAKAQRERTLVLLEITGETCVRGRFVHIGTFRKPEVQAALKPYVLAALYVDTVPTAFYTRPPSAGRRRNEARSNLQWQVRQFDTEELPLYAVLRPVGKGKFKITSTLTDVPTDASEKFIEFLRKHKPRS